MITDISTEFKKARIAVLSETAVTEGVGGLSEKSVHKMLKLTLEPNSKNHEVKCLGSIADIKNDNGIYEIQSKSPERLIKKLDKFLPVSRVTLVIPIISEKYIRWINTETGEISEPRKSPAREDVYTALKALAPIAHYLENENFSVKLVFLRADQYKRLDGWDKSKKRGASKSDRIPSDILSVIDIASPCDAAKFFPESLNGVFLAKDFAKAIKRPSRFTYYVIKFFENLGIVEMIGKEGRAFLYKTNI